MTTSRPLSIRFSTGQQPDISSSSLDFVFFVNDSHIIFQPGFQIVAWLSFVVGKNMNLSSTLSFLITYYVQVLIPNKVSLITRHPLLILLLLHPSLPPPSFGTRVWVPTSLGSYPSYWIHTIPSEALSQTPATPNPSLRSFRWHLRKISYFIFIFNLYNRLIGIWMNYPLMDIQLKNSGASYVWRFINTGRKLTSSENRTKTIQLNL